MLRFEEEVLPFGSPVDEDLPFASEIDEPGAEVWHIAPNDSHVDSFRFLDADPAEIHVKFKPKGNQPLTEYKYTFQPGQRDHARIIWEEMAAANHPGIVIWEWLIRGGVAYQRVG